MVKNVVTDTNIMFYLMIAVGVIGVTAKIVNQVVLRRVVRASSNMPKSTHKLMKLVRAKYEHACMIHDTVDNIDAFVEKYIYEYRGALFRIHTWRQLEIQSIWFSGILAAVGAFVHFASRGFCEEMYQFIALGAAEMIMLFVVSQMSDEMYKIKVAKTYMVDYLENVCAHRFKKTKTAEREMIDVISPENVTAGRAPTFRDEPELSINIEGEPRRAKSGKAAREISGEPTGSVDGGTVRAASEESYRGTAREMSGELYRGAAREVPGESYRSGDWEMFRTSGGVQDRENGGERYRMPDGGEDRRSGEEASMSRQSGHRAVRERSEENGQSALKEEAIRQILEEFLA